MHDAATGRPAAAPSTPERLQIGDVLLDRAAHRVSVRSHAIVLALQEFRLLDLLMSNADHVVASPVILVRKPSMSDSPTIASTSVKAASIHQSGPGWLTNHSIIGRMKMMLLGRKLLNFSPT